MSGLQCAHADKEHMCELGWSKISPHLIAIYHDLSIFTLVG